MASIHGSCLQLTALRSGLLLCPSSAVSLQAQPRAPLPCPHLHELVSRVLLLLLLLIQTRHRACQPGQGTGLLVGAPALLLELQTRLQAASAARC